MRPLLLVFPLLLINHSGELHDQCCLGVDSGVRGSTKPSCILAYLDINNKALDLSECSLVDDSLFWLFLFGHIEELWLGHTSITDKGIRYLVNLPKLRVLNLAQTKISNSALKGLESLQNLEELNIVNTAVTDKGMECLASIKSLRVIYLTSAEIGDAGLMLLVKLPVLNHIYVTDTFVTKDGIAQFTKQRPDVSVIQQFRRTSLAPAPIIDHKKVVPHVVAVHVLIYHFWAKSVMELA